jgi:hypothetical protein
VRPTRIGREVRAACFVCHGGSAHWTSANAQGVAARHHDATGHATWVRVVMTIHYGREHATVDDTMNLPGIK